MYKYKSNNEIVKLNSALKNTLTLGWYTDMSDSMHNNWDRGNFPVALNL
jgi:hypothetical protein